MISMATMAVLVSVALVCFIVTLPSVWAQPGTLHIDCGGPLSYTDDFGVTWEPDNAYIETGEVGRTQDQTVWSGWQELQNNRFFPSARAKNCYTLPVTPKQTYMLRAEFMFGEYSGSLPPYPSFQISIDSSIVENVTVVRPYSNYIRELTFAANRDVTSFCLVRDESKTTPFINSISLRAVPNLPPTVMESLALNQSVSTMTRLQFTQTGGYVIVYNKYGEPSDVYDRYWYGTNGTQVNSYPMRTASEVTNTAPLEFLSVANTRNVSIDSNAGGLANNIPQNVLQGAMTTAGNLTIPMNTTVPFRAYMQYYFVELDETVNVTDRSFFIESPGSDVPYQNNIVNFTGGPLRLWLVTHKRAFITYDSNIIMYPDPARTSLKGPILSGLEVFRVDIPYVRPTMDRDYNAIKSIKTDMQLTSWGGDPCLPYPHDWLTCNLFNGLTEATVVTIVLSGNNLTGAISPAFDQLLSITSLNLDNNSLTGPIPDLRALKNLKFLRLQNNNLTGPLPDWLASLPLQELSVQNNALSGTFPGEFLTKNWNFNYSGNPLLKPGAPSPPKESNIGAIVGGVVGGVVALAVIVGLAVFCYCRRRGGKKNVDGPVVELQTNPSSHASAAKPGGAREYSLVEVDAATERYKKVIGKGGFGTVYYGRLPDGKEVAVKTLDKTSKQGQTEFSNEVDILSRVHHKHLVSLVGYCKAVQKQMLIYEYIHKGSLRDHLDGDAHKTGAEILDWKTRLNIGLQAALGLEYLHTGCSPSLIHRDVKSTNILITSKNEAKVADFGLSKLVGEDDSAQMLTMVKGTAGYLDPEYYHTNYLSAKSDVYSFGVVLLELITGRLPIDRTIPNQSNPNLVDWVRSSLTQGDINVILDPRLLASRPNHDALWKVAEVALRSVEPKSVHRPTMNEVVQELQGAVALEEKAETMMSSSSSYMGPPPRHSRIPSGYSDYSSSSQVQFAPDSASYPTPR